MWVFLLTTKNGTLGVFCKFPMAVEHETDERMKTFSSDRGDE